MQLHPLSGALPHDGSVSLSTGCPSPPWLIQVCQDVSLRTLHHLLSTQLPIPQGPGKVSGSPSGLWKHSGSLFPHVFLPLSGEALAAALPRTPYPVPQVQPPTQTPPGQSTQTWRFYPAPTVYPLVLRHRLGNPVWTADPALAPQNTQPGHFSDWWRQKLRPEATHAQDLQPADLYCTV